MSHGFDDAGDKDLIWNVEDVADRVSRVLHDHAEKCPHRYHEPHREDREKERTWVHESRELPAQNSVAHGWPPVVLNTSATLKAEELV